MLFIIYLYIQVGYINFDPSFRPVLPTDNDNDEENDLEVSPEGEEEVSPRIIEVEEYATNITTYRVQDNIYSQDAKIQNKVCIYLSRLFLKVHLFINFSFAKKLNLFGKLITHCNLKYPIL